MKNGYLNSVSAAVLLMGVAAPLMAQESLPAVAGFGGKLEFGYSFSGSSASGKGAYAIGSVNIPVGHSFGVQLDVMGDVQKNSAKSVTGANGAAVHLFTRDPSSYLLGVYAHSTQSRSSLGNIRNTRFGIEGEAYLGNVSVEGFIGKDRVKSLAGTQNSTSIDLEVGYYANDNLRFSVGAERSFNITSGRIGVEKGLTMAGMSGSVFGAATFNKHGTTATIGTKIFFGAAGSSLKSNHREADPRTRFSSASKMNFYDALTNGRRIKIPVECVGKCDLY